MSEQMIGNEERIELYKAFIKAMLKEDFSIEYIGRELALLAHALFMSK